MSLTKKIMIEALTSLDRKLTHSAQLIVGGGGAMLLAHGFPLTTYDIDAIPAQGISINEIDVLVKEVANDLKIQFDWLNPYYSTFTHVLPQDYGTRLVTICELNMLLVRALSKDDLLIMKCFAGRHKDRPHAIALIQSGADVKFVEKHIELLQKKGIHGATKALDFLDEVTSQI